MGMHLHHLGDLAYRTKSSRDPISARGDSSLHPKRRPWNMQPYGILRHLFTKCWGSMRNSSHVARWSTAQVKRQHIHGSDRPPGIWLKTRKVYGTFQNKLMVRVVPCTMTHGQDLHCSFLTFSCYVPGYPGRISARWTKPNKPLSFSF